MFAAFSKFGKICGLTFIEECIGIGGMLGGGIVDQ